MIEDSLVKLSSLGISGLFFVMWWFERLDRMRLSGGMRETVESASRVADVNAQLVDVIKSNTEAVTALREELRSHRATEIEWLRRLTRQVEKLDAA